MGDTKMIRLRTRRLAACLVACLAVGCVQMQLKMREPGEFNRGFPDEVADEYHCAKRPLPFLAVEEDELLPERLSPGDEFNHRLQYVLCPVDDTQVVSGTLHTRILYKGKPILTESIQRDLQPGRWVVDSFITLPNDAKPGVYALQTEFTSKKGGFDTRATFLVEN